MTVIQPKLSFITYSRSEYLTHYWGSNSHLYADDSKISITRHDLSSQHQINMSNYLSISLPGCGTGDISNSVSLSSARKGKPPIYLISFNEQSSISFLKLDSEVFAFSLFD